MPPPTAALRRDAAHPIWLAALSLVLCLGWFFMDGNVRVHLADEGYLWYGTQAMRLGQIPAVDFQAYDPGRYVWTVAWSYLFGQDLVAMRLACTLFQCLGVFAGLLVARRLSRHWFFLGTVALLLCVWMHPRYKSFEQSIALMSIYAGVLLLERPTLRRHFVVGIFGGLMAFIGRNHGVYHIVAFSLLIVWAAWGQSWRTLLQRAGVWVGGTLVGYLPQWLMFLFIPGYFHRCWLDLMEILAHGTNLRKEVVWPWFVSQKEPLWWRLPQTAESFFYLALLILPVLIVWQLWRRKKAQAPIAPALVAAGCVSLAYTHYAFSRPDIVHVAHAAPAMALGWLAWIGAVAPRWSSLLAVVLLGASTLANVLQLGIAIRLFSPPNLRTTVEVGGQQMTTTPSHLQVISAARKIADELARPDEPILFLPSMPALYPITERLSPVREIYLILPATPEEDADFLQRVKDAGVAWVMLYDFALDSRDDLRFRNTHPQTYRYFVESFEPVPMPGLPPDYAVLRRKPAAAARVTAPERPQP